MKQLGKKIKAFRKFIQVIFSKKKISVPIDIMNPREFDEDDLAAISQFLKTKAGVQMLRQLYSKSLEISFRHGRLTEFDDGMRRGVLMAAEGLLELAQQSEPLQ